MASNGLDKIDLKILALLQADGRMSHLELAERVGLSPTPCARRVRRLEKAGVIAGYAARIDPRRVGQKVMAFIHIKLDRHTDEVVDQFRKLLADRSEVIAAHALTGDMDFLVEVMVEDLDALGRLTLHELLKLPGVRDVRSGVVLETLKAGRSIPLLG